VPNGAAVTVGINTGTTPCRLEVPKGACTASFVLPSGQTKKVEVPAGPGIARKAVSVVLSGSSGFLLIASVPFFAVGGGALLLLSMITDDDSSDLCPAQHDDSDHDAELHLLRYGVAGLGIGAMLAIFSEALRELAPDFETFTSVTFEGGELSPHASPVVPPSRAVRTTLPFWNVHQNDRLWPSVATNNMSQ
jgi:hypothetical protein